jgi:hypothetical protein
VAAGEELRPRSKGASNGVIEALQVLSRDQRENQKEAMERVADLLKNVLFPRPIPFS